jgi:hypothetical protein
MDSSSEGAASPSGISAEDNLKILKLIQRKHEVAAAKAEVASRRAAGQACAAFQKAESMQRAAITEAVIATAPAPASTLAETPKTRHRQRSLSVSSIAADLSPQAQAQAQAQAQHAAAEPNRLDGSTPSSRSTAPAAANAAKAAGATRRSSLTFVEDVLR